MSSRNPLHAWTTSAGFSWRPAWRALSCGQRPPKPSGEPGEWPHGWQCWPLSVSDPHLREGVFTVRPDGRSSDAPSLSLQLERRRHSRPRTNSKGVHTATTLVPRVALATVATPASCDRGAVRRRSCFSRCQWAPPSGVLLDREVGEEGDTHGAHPDVPRSRGEGRIQRVPSRHERGGPCSRWETHRGSGSRHPGRCPIGCGHHIAERYDLGKPHPQAADVDGAVLMAARREKETTHPELAASGRCKLVVVGTETGGRWNESS